MSIAKRIRLAFLVVQAIDELVERTAEEVKEAREADSDGGENITWPEALQITEGIADELATEVAPLVLAHLGMDAGEAWTHRERWVQTKLHLGHDPRE